MKKTMHTDVNDIDGNLTLKFQIENENVRDRLIDVFRRFGHPLTLKRLAEEAGVGWCKVATIINKRPNTFVKDENTGIRSGGCRNHILALIAPHPHITAHWPEWKVKP